MILAIVQENERKIEDGKISLKILDRIEQDKTQRSINDSYKKNRGDSLVKLLRSKKKHILNSQRNRSKYMIKKNLLV